MSYAATAVIQSYMPPGYTLNISPGVPSNTQVAQFLTDTSNEIDAALASRGLSVPVAAPAWFVSDLTRLNAQGAAALVLLQMAPMISGQTGGSGGAPNNSLGQTLQAAFKKTLTDYRSGVGIPVAVATQENDLAARGYLTDTGAYGQPDGSVLDAVGNPINAQPAFSREMTF